MAKRGRNELSDAGARVLARFRSLCLDLPGTTETGSWGHPNFRAGKRTFAAYEVVNGRPSMAFRLAPDEVRHFLTMRGFFQTPYGRGMWVSLDAAGRISWSLVKTLTEQSYRLVAPKRMIDTLEARKSIGSAAPSVLT